MGRNADPIHAYRQTRVKTASQGRIIVMLYDEAVRQIDLAREAMEEGTKQLDRINTPIVKAQDIITELMVSLDFERGGDMARNLFRVYMFFNNELMDANFSKNSAPLSRVRGFLVSLREAWDEITRNGASGESSADSGGGVNIAG